MNFFNDLSKTESLFIFNDFPPVLGGQSQYYFNLCRALPPEKIMVLAPKVGNTASFDQALPFSVIRKFYLTRLPIFEKLLKIILPIFYALPIIKRGKFKFIHCGHVLSTGISGIILKKLTGIPFIVYAHGSDVLEYQKWPLIKTLLCRILNGADYVITNSSFTHDCIKELGISAAKIIIVHPRIDAAYFKQAPDTTEILSKYNLTGKHLILSINRLVKRKGNDLVIKALSEIDKIFLNAIYVIVGDGPEKSKLKNLAGKIGLGNRVLFLTSLNETDIKALLHACDVFVMPSSYLTVKGDAEGFGIVFLEANAAGKPVIGGRSGGIPDAIADKITGLLIDPENRSELSQAIVKLLWDKELREKMGRAGQQRVFQRFDYRAGIRELNCLFVNERMADGGKD